MSDDPPDDDYVVGYRHPPKEHQFKKGQSGNMKGRPRNPVHPAFDGAGEMDQLEFKEAYRRVTVTENGREKRMAIIAAATRARYIAALKGDHRAQKQSFDALHAAEKRALERARKADIQFNEMGQAAVAVKEKYTAEAARFKAAGKPPPERYPHPDDIIIDPFTSAVTVVGPRTKEQKEEWDNWAINRQEIKEVVQGVADQLKDKMSRNRREVIEGIVEKGITHLELLDKLYPPPELRRGPAFNPKVQEKYAAEKRALRANFRVRRTRPTDPPS